MNFIFTAIIDDCFGFASGMSDHDTREKAVEAGEALQTQARAAGIFGTWIRIVKTNG